MSIAPVLIFAIGNQSRGDDALGPLLLQRVEHWLQQQGLSEQFELQEEYQLQIEHVTDMEQRKLVMFIDAGMDTPAPFGFYPVAEQAQSVLYSHALNPEQLLHVYSDFYQQEPPASFILCIKGESFELGERLSALAQAHLQAAEQFILQRLQTADLNQWQQAITQQSLAVTV